MRAVVYDSFEAPPQLREVNDPAPPPGGVVIAVRATGLCRSDWHGWRGHDPDIRLPHVPGHEFAGEVAAVGAGVRHWRVGDRVTAPFICACGTCAACLTGDQQVCERQEQPGFTHWGSFAELMVVHFAQVNLVRLPGDVRFAAAAALGCRFATSFRAVIDQGRVSAGDWVARPEPSWCSTVSGTAKRRPAGAVLCWSSTGLSRTDHRASCRGSVPATCPERKVHSP